MRVHVDIVRGSLKCPRLSMWGGEGVKNGQNLVHVVVECPLTREEVLKSKMTSGNIFSTPNVQQTAAFRWKYFDLLPFKIFYPKIAPSVGLKEIYYGLFRNMNPIYKNFFWQMQVQGSKWSGTYFVWKYINSNTKICSKTKKSFTPKKYEHRSVSK